MEVAPLLAAPVLLGDSGTVFGTAAVKTTDSIHAE
jgi:hypothetical protein